MLRNKNKYQSQQISKKFKNKHRNAFPLKSSLIQKSKKYAKKWCRKCATKNCQRGSKKELKRLKKHHFKNCHTDCAIIDCALNKHANANFKLEKYGYITLPYDNYDIFDVLTKKPTDVIDNDSNDLSWFNYRNYVRTNTENLSEQLCGMIFDDLYNFEEKYHWKCSYNKKNKHLSQTISKKFKNKHKQHKYNKLRSTKCDKHKIKMCKKCQKNRYRFGSKEKASDSKKSVYKSTNLCSNNQYYSYQDLYDAFDEIDQSKSTDEQYTELDIDETKEEIHYDKKLITRLANNIQSIDPNINHRKSSKESQDTYCKIATKICRKPTPKIILSTEPTFDYTQSRICPTIKKQISYSMISEIDIDIYKAPIDYYSAYLYSVNKHNHLYSFNMTKKEWFESKSDNYTSNSSKLNLYKEHKPVQIKVELTGYIHLNKYKTGGFIICDDSPKNTLYDCKRKIFFDRKDCNVYYGNLVGNERILFDMIHCSVKGFISGPMNIRLPEMKRFMSDNDTHLLTHGYILMYTSYYDIFLPKDIRNLICWFYNQYEKHQIAYDVICCTEYYNNRFVINSKNECRNNTMISKVGLKNDPNQQYKFKFAMLKRPTEYLRFGIVSHPRNIIYYIVRNENKWERHHRWCWDEDGYANGSNYFSFRINPIYVCDGDIFNMKIKLNGSNCSIKYYRNNSFKDFKQFDVFDDDIYFPFIVFGNADKNDDAVEFEFWPMNNST